MERDDSSEEIQERLEEALDEWQKLHQEKLMLKEKIMTLVDELEE